MLAIFQLARMDGRISNGIILEEHVVPGLLPVIVSFLVARKPSNQQFSNALRGPSTVSRTFRLHAIQRRLQFPADVVRRRFPPPPTIARATPAR